MFQSQVYFPITRAFDGDLSDETYALWVAPAACEILDITAVAGAAVTGSGTSIVLTLYNAGTSGTATTAIGTVGGTAHTWTADVPLAGTVASGTNLTTGQVLTLKYDETGTVNSDWMTVVVHARYGT